MFLTFAEACVHLRVSHETLRSLIKNGEIEAHKTGSGGRTSPYRIDIASINAYVERNTIKPVQVRS